MGRNGIGGFVSLGNGPFFTKFQHDSNFLLDILVI
jgi:hypothetical protein